MFCYDTLYLAIECLVIYRSSCTSRSEYWTNKLVMVDDDKWADVTMSPRRQAHARLFTEPTDWERPQYIQYSMWTGSTIDLHSLHTDHQLYTLLEWLQELKSNVSRRDVTRVRTPHWANTRYVIYVWSKFSCESVECEFMLHTLRCVSCIKTDSFKGAHTSLAVIIAFSLSIAHTGSIYVIKGLFILGLEPCRCIVYNFMNANRVIDVMK